MTQIFQFPGRFVLGELTWQDTPARLYQRNPHSGLGQLFRSPAACRAGPDNHGVKLLFTRLYKHNGRNQYGSDKRARMSALLIDIIDNAKEAIQQEFGSIQACRDESISRWRVRLSVVRKYCAQQDPTWNANQCLGHQAGPDRHAVRSASPNKRTWFQRF